MSNFFICEECNAKVPADADTCPACQAIFNGCLCPKCGYSGKVSAFTSGCPACGFQVLGNSRAKVKNRQSSLRLLIVGIAALTATLLGLVGLVRSYFL